MRNIQIMVVSEIVDDSLLCNLSNTFFNEYINLINFDADIYTDKGDLICKFRKNIIPDDMCKILYENLKGVATLQRGRPEASGLIDKYSYIKSKSTGKIIHQLNSKARSGIIGFYDNKSFFGHKRVKENTDGSNEMCRQTSYTAKHWEKYQNCLNVFTYIDKLYKKLLPQYYKKQKKAISRIDPNYIINNTVFTTITVNKNFRTALHKDKGDFKDGFGILTVVTDTDDYKGGYTLFPKYGLAIDCRHCDFLAMNVHEFHCNSKKTGDGNRVSFVYYLREKMLNTCPNK
jgi:hypothetical protein